MYGYKQISMTHQQGLRGVRYLLLSTNLGDKILCTFSPNHNIHWENGIDHWWSTYALKSESVSEMHFPVIWRSKFTDLANSKKSQSSGKNGCRQKSLDKSLTVEKKNFFCHHNFMKKGHSKLYKNEPEDIP